MSDDDQSTKISEARVLVRVGGMKPSEVAAKLGLFPGSSDRGAALRMAIRRQEEREAGAKSIPAPTPSVNPADAAGDGERVREASPAPDLASVDSGPSSSGIEPAAGDPNTGSSPEAPEPSQPILTEEGDYWSQWWPVDQDAKYVQFVETATAEPVLAPLDGEEVGALADKVEAADLARGEFEARSAVLARQIAELAELKSLLHSPVPAREGPDLAPLLPALETVSRDIQSVESGLGQLGGLSAQVESLRLTIENLAEIIRLESSRSDGRANEISASLGIPISRLQAQVSKTSDLILVSVELITRYLDRATKWEDWARKEHEFAKGLNDQVGRLTREKHIAKWLKASEAAR